MPTPNLPAASLSPQLPLPARQALLRVANDLIRHALWSIGVAILRAELNFLPALREADRRRSGSGHARLSVPFRPCLVARCDVRYSQPARSTAGGGPCGLARRPNRGRAPPRAARRARAAR